MQHAVEITWSTCEQLSLVGSSFFYFRTFCSLELVRNVVDKRLLDAYGSLQVIKRDNLMNKDKGSIPFSCLEVLLK